MKSLKIYLIIVSILLVVAIGLGVYVWYALQQLNSEVTGTMTERVETKKESEEVPKETQTRVTKPILIKTKDLPPAQQKIVEGLGFTQGTITFTPDMVSCAEDAVGKDRVTEIIGGATPGPLEAVSLIPCLKK